jgi:hypothetical protein
VTPARMAIPAAPVCRTWQMPRAGSSPGRSAATPPISAAASACQPCRGGGVFLWLLSIPCVLCLPSAHRGQLPELQYGAVLHFLPKRPPVPRQRDLPGHQRHHLPDCGQGAIRVCLCACTWTRFQHTAFMWRAGPGVSRPAVETLPLRGMQGAGEPCNKGGLCDGTSATEAACRPFCARFGAASCVCSGANECRICCVHQANLTQACDSPFRAFNVVSSLLPHV